MAKKMMIYINLPEDNPRSGAPMTRDAMADRNAPNNFARYERIAAFYDRLDLPFEYGWHRRIRPLLFQGLSGRLLDAGVGTGRNIPFYPSGSDVVGIDISPRMLGRAERRIDRSAATSIELKTMDVTALDFADRSFDAAVATFLFCVLPDESQAPALRELGRVVKIGGAIRLLNYVRPRRTFLGAAAKLFQPYAEWAFAANLDRRTEQSISEVGLELFDSRYVVHDLIRLIEARAARP
jgi:ubiquinone/menaquinone biosynthesis C-methylase UbiE